MGYCKKIFVLLGLTISLLTLATPLAAHAYDPLDKACAVTGGSNGPDSSSVCSGRTTTDPVSGNNGVLRKVTTIIALIAGVAAVIVAMISGIQFLTSAGDPQAAASARKTLIGAIVGLAIIVLAQSLILFVVSKL